MALSDYMRSRQEHINKGRPLAAKKVYGLNKVSPKRQAKLDAEKAERGDNGMDLFFKSMRPKMKGVCFFCGGKSEKANDEMYFFSLAHLLPKTIFKSVATHPDILIELCFFGNSCHTNFDNGKITWELIKDSKEWEVIKEKLLIVLPLVAPEERKHKLYSKLINLVYGNI